MKTSFKSIQPCIMALVACAGVLLALSPAVSKAAPTTNTMYGTGALNQAGASANGNSAFGYYPLYNDSTGSYNTAVGLDALYENTTGGENTADGDYALFSNTTASWNAASGYAALLSNTIGTRNTATGAYTLSLNTIGSYNTAAGYSALYYSTTASWNAAFGYGALFLNTTGSSNTAEGYEALFNNTTGYYNVANGYDALYSNTIGTSNTADGQNALYYNTSGIWNTATGSAALFYNIGSYNTADGEGAMYFNSTGNNNIAIGNNAGKNLTTGSYNIDIGNQGNSAETNTIRVGVHGLQTAAYIAGIYGEGPSTTGSYAAVYADSNGTLFTALPAPVADSRASRTPGPGAHNEIAMLEKSNKALKASSTKLEAAVAEQAKHFALQEQINAQQQQQIRALTASLKEQASLLQKVSAQMQVNRSTPQVVSNNN